MLFWTTAHILSAIKQRVPGFENSNLQHLRRFVKEEYLPTHLKIQPTPNPVSSGEPQTDNPIQEDDNSGASEEAPEKPELKSHLFICPTTSISISALTELLSSTAPFASSGTSPSIRVIPVPLYAPTSGEQAAYWSNKYWPISYKNTNPYGPHPSIIKRAESEVAPTVGLYMSLAEKCAQTVLEKNIGINTGCVVVEKKGDSSQVVAVAGDGRWHGRPCSGAGNVTAHAVMRAIGMVAKKRLRIAEKEGDSEGKESSSANSGVMENDSNPATPVPAIFDDNPLTELEEQFFSQDNIAPHGYLCAGLDIYITHEPCVMCSMAILHSRFERCVFGKRMLLTGALTADSQPSNMPQKGLEHGLFWLPSELNWKLLCWEYELEGDDILSIEKTVQV